MSVTARPPAVGDVPEMVPKLFDGNRRYAASMCRMLIVIAVAALARDALADAKTQKMATGYQREARSCKIQGDGVAKVIDGATTMQAQDNDDAVAADLAQLRAAQEPIQNFCSELGAMIELLRADPSATYKSLEPQILQRDKKIRELRKPFKQVTEGVTPIIRRLVPRINKRAAAAAISAAEKKREPSPPAPPPAPTPTAAPAPKPTPPPVVKMTEGPTTSLAVRSFTGGTCDDQAKQIEKKAAALERAQPMQRSRGNLAWLPGARWKASYGSGDRFVQVECVSTKVGGFVLTLEGPNPPSVDRELLDVAARALAATAK